MKKLIPFALLILILSGCSRHSDLHESMEDMGDSFKTMRESSDIAQIKQELAGFKQALEIASAQQVKPEDQAAFDKGMDEVNSLTDGLEAAITAGNINEAKAMLKRLGEARKKYHDELGVK